MALTKPHARRDRVQECMECSPLEALQDWGNIANKGKELRKYEDRPCQSVRVRYGGFDWY